MSSAFPPPETHRKPVPPDLTWVKERDAARKPGLSREEMRAFSEHPHSAVRRSVVLREDFPRSWLTKMAKDPNPRVIEAVSWKTNAPRDVTEKLANHYDYAIRAHPRWHLGWPMTLREICEYAITTTSFEDLDRLASHRNREVRRVIAQRKDLPERLNVRLSDDSDWYIRQQLLWDSKPLPSHLFEKLARDSSWLVRRAVPRNKHCPDWLVEELMGDKSPWVRQGVVTAYRLSPETLDPLAGDKSRQVRLALKERARDAPFLAKLAALKERSRQNRATPPSP